MTERVNWSIGHSHGFAVTLDKRNPPTPTCNGFDISLFLMSRFHGRTRPKVGPSEGYTESVFFFLEKVFAHFVPFQLFDFGVPRPNLTVHGPFRPLHAVYLWFTTVSVF